MLQRAECRDWITDSDQEQGTLLRKSSNISVITKETVYRHESICVTDADPCDKGVHYVTDSTIIIEDLQRCKGAWGRAQQVEIKYIVGRYAFLLLTGLFAYSTLDAEPSLTQ